MDIENIIKDKNLKLTPARKEILELFSKEKKPVCFEDIKHKLNMDKATFYRNVSRFQDEDILISFESNDKKRYYELHNIEHAHFVCNECNKIECLNGIEALKLDGYKITDIIYKGLCKECNS